MATSGKELAVFGSFKTVFKYDYICQRCCDSKDTQFVDASHYCAQCEEYFCRSCLRYACDHDLIGCKDVGLGGRLDHMQFSCKIHPGNRLDSFCGSHDLVCCTVCALVLHKIVADTLIYGTPLANRVDPDETAPTGAVSSGSTLFANTSNHVTMRCCSNFETTSRAEKRVKQNAELEKLRKEFFGLQKRVYTLRSKYPTTPDTDRELLKNINDYRTAINTLLDEFEKDAKEEIEEMKQKCSMRKQMNDLMKTHEMHDKLDAYSRHLIHLKIEKALDYDNKKNLPDIDLDDIMAD